MVWGGVSRHHRTEFIVIAGNLNTVHYREDILLPHVVPFLQAHPDMTHQHDNVSHMSVSHMSVELVQFMSQLLNLVMFIQIFTHVKFAENKRS